jgi:hypothetical protein
MINAWRRSKGVVTAALLLSVPVVTLVCFGGTAWSAFRAQPDASHPDIAALALLEDIEGADTVLAGDDADVAADWEDTLSVKQVNLRLGGLFKSLQKVKNATARKAILLQITRLRTLLPAARKQDALNGSLVRVNTALKKAAPGSATALALAARRAVLLAELRSLNTIQASILTGRLAGRQATARLALFTRREQATQQKLNVFATQLVQGTASSSTFRFAPSF